MAASRSILRTRATKQRCHLMRVEAIGKGRGPHQWQPPAPFLRANAWPAKTYGKSCAANSLRDDSTSAWPAMTKKALLACIFRGIASKRKACKDLRKALHCLQFAIRDKQTHGLQGLTESLARPAITKHLQRLQGLQ